MSNNKLFFSRKKKRKGFGNSFELIILKKCLNNYRLIYLETVKKTY